MTKPRFTQKAPQYWRHTRHTSAPRSNWRQEAKSFLNWRELWARPQFRKLILRVVLAGGVLLIAGFIWLSSGLPSPNSLITREIPESTKIYDRTGETILYDIHGDEKRTLVTLDKIPQHVRDATIAIEDKDFYHHKGFSLWAIVRTIVTNVLGNRKAGGSTLTQQFVKNAVLTNEKSYIRKLKELILAYRMEKKFSKDEILQMYFNEIPYGSNAYGIEAASLKYFGKHVQEINLSEAAILAAIVQSPTRYSPYGPNKDILLERQKYVLDLMVNQDKISEEEADKAKNEKIAFKDPADNNITAPHFVMHIKEMLAEKYGEKFVEQGGLKITTTLDTYKQEIAEEVVKKKALENDKRWRASNAALVSLDPKTGQVLAMVGSRDYFDKDIDGQVNVALKLRQPGSSFKPIAYATAFSLGYTPNTVLYDVVTNFAAAGPAYEPRNYNNKEYGPISMRNALAGSLNTPAVKTLYLAGLGKVQENAKKLGYTSLDDKDRFGLSLVLGGGEVQLLEHANAFSAFARDGVLHDPNFILKVEDRTGKVLEEYKSEERRVFEANVAREINSVLSDNNARAYIFGAQNFLTLGNRPVAAKTGTTNNNRDAWTIGYTPSLVTGVWVGNNDNSAMKSGADGSVVAGPIWNEYMRRVLGTENIESFAAPKIPVTGKAVLDGTNIGGTKIKIDKASGLLATDRTPASFIEERTYQTVHDILYFVNKSDPLGPAPKNPAADPQYNLWESRVQAWAKKNNINSEEPPTEYDNLHIPENLPTLAVLNLSEGQTVNSSQLSVKIEASAPRGVNRAEYYINSNLLQSNSSFPFGLDANIDFLPNGYYELTVRVCDDIDNCSEKKINFNLKAGKNSTNGSISVALNSPSNGKIFGPTDFPAALRATITNPRLVAKVNFYLVNANKETTTIGSVSAPNQVSAESTWTSMPPNGTYSIYAEAISWQNQKVTSGTITVIVAGNTSPSVTQ